MKTSTANALLLLAGAIWGMGFIAQQTAMRDMGPMLFVACRFLLAAAVVAPFALRELARRDKHADLRAAFKSFILLGCVFFLGMALQQIGLLGTTVTNAGFLTTLYVVLVPLIMLTVFREQPPVFVWPAMVVSVIGIYCLNGGRIDQIVWGDWYILAGAVVWAVHVILVSRFAKQSALPIVMTCTTFAVSGLLGLLAHVFATLFDIAGQEFRWSMILAALPEILYAGIFSGGVAFTLQAIGQRYTRPSIAAILMSSESLFAAVFGAFFLGERLGALGYVGCALILAAIVAVEALQSRRDEKAPLQDSIQLDTDTDTDTEV